MGEIAYGGVAVRGLLEWQAALRAIERTMPSLLRIEMKKIADHVVGVAQQKMPFSSGDAARSLRPRATQRGAAIARPGGGGPWQGSKTADYEPWLDFGGSVGKGHVPGKAWSGSVQRDAPIGGRYLYPAIGQSTGWIVDSVGDAIERVARSQGFDTRSGG